MEDPKTPTKSIKQEEEKTCDYYYKYQHVEHLGRSSTKGLLTGTVHVFHKVDGTNGKIWKDENGVICAGSRNQKLDKKNTNQGFSTWVFSSEEIKNYMDNYPDDILFGEWLVPHQEKYIKDVIRVFYVFEVITKRTVPGKTEQETVYQPYDDYINKLEEFGIKYIPRIATLVDPEHLSGQDLLEKATFLTEKGAVGEGIVIKNYDYHNKYGHQTWGKIITSEFKEKKGVKHLSHGTTPFIQLLQT